MRFLFYFLNILLSINSFSQEIFFVEENGKEHQITKTTSKNIVDDYLNYNDFKAIEFNPVTDSKYSFRVKTKKGNWILSDEAQAKFIVVPKYSVNFPTKSEEAAGITTFENGNKKYFYSLTGIKPVMDIWFDERKEIIIIDTLYDHDNKSIEKRSLYALNQKNKWSIVYLDTQQDESDPIFRLTPFAYDSYEELPMNIAKEYLKGLSNYKIAGIPFIYFQLEELYNQTEITDIAFNEKDLFSMPRVRDKNGDWYLFDMNNVELIGKEGYSLLFDEFDCGAFTLAEKNGSKYLFTLGDEGYQLLEHFPFDELKEHKDWWEVEAYDMYGNTKVDEEGNTVMDSIEFCDYLVVRRGNKWALAQYDKNMDRVYQLTGFHFDQPNDVPADSVLGHYIENATDKFHIEYNSTAMQGAEKMLQKNKELDLVLFDRMYSLDDQVDVLVYEARDADTKKWSLITVGEKPENNDFPTDYTKIKHHVYNPHAIVLEVWLDDKVGYYFYNGEYIKQIMECEYEDFKYVFLDATYGCALKKNGKWELYKMDTPERMVEGKAETIDELTEMWLNR